MSAWKDDRLANDILSGKVSPPTPPNQRWILIAVAGVVAILSVWLILPRHGALSASRAVVSPEAPPAQKAPAPPVQPAIVAARAPQILQEPAPVASHLPAVKQSSAEIKPAAFLNPSQSAETKSRCRVSDLELVRTNVSASPTGAGSLEDALRIEENARGDVAKLEEARDMYQRVLESGKLEEGGETQCLNRLTELANRLVLDPHLACTHPQAVFHKVEPGDSAEKIARKYKVNQGQLKRINRLNDKLMVRYGQTLKILPGDVVYKVDRTHLTGTLFIGGVFIRRYPVGIGPGSSTPVGTYTVERKVMNPDWYYDGKRIPFGDAGNILGTRWMGFSASDNAGQGAGLGVHGTALPASVPGRESKGCVRMHNADVEELYDLMPQGGRVEIAD